MDLQKQLSARKLFFFSVLILLSLSAFSPLPQDPGGEPILDRILRIAIGFGSLVGVSALVGILVAFLRAGNIVKTDEQAGRATASLNLVAFIVLVALGIFRPDLALDYLDSTAATIASIGLFVLGLVIQIITPAPVLRLAYQARVPVLGSVGERVEMRAHFVGGPLKVVDAQKPENWTAEKPSKRH